MKKRDKRDYIIAALSFTCSVLLFLLFKQHDTLNSKSDELAKKDEVLKVNEESNKYTYGALKNKNKIKDLKIDSLNKQISNLTDRISENESVKGSSSGQVSALEKALKEISEQSQKSLEELTELKSQNEKLNNELITEKAKSKKTTKSSYRKPTKIKYKYTAYKPTQSKTYKRKTYTKFKPTYNFNNTYKKPSTSLFRFPASTTKKKTLPEEAKKSKIEDLGDVFEE